MKFPVYIVRSKSKYFVIIIIIINKNKNNALKNKEMSSNLTRYIVGRESMKKIETWP